MNPNIMSILHINSLNESKRNVHLHLNSPNEYKHNIYLHLNSSNESKHNSQSCLNSRNESTSSTQHRGNGSIHDRGFRFLRCLNQLGKNEKSSHE